LQEIILSFAIDIKSLKQHRIHCQISIDVFFELFQYALLIFIDIAHLNFALKFMFQRLHNINDLIRSLIFFVLKNCHNNDRHSVHHSFIVMEIQFRNDLHFVFPNEINQISKSDSFRHHSLLMIIVFDQHDPGAINARILLVNTLHSSYWSIFSCETSEDFHMSLFGSSVSLQNQKHIVLFGQDIQFFLAGDILVGRSQSLTYPFIKFLNSPALSVLFSVHISYFIDKQSHKWCVCHRIRVQSSTVCSSIQFG